MGFAHSPSVTPPRTSRNRVARDYRKETRATRIEGLVERTTQPVRATIRLRSYGGTDGFALPS